MTENAMRESLEAGVRSVIPEMRARIYDRGEDANGQSIGTYSTKPITLSISQMAKTTGGRPTKSGKGRHFEGGYAEYKRSLGTSKYNLRNFGVFMRDFISPAIEIKGDEAVARFKTDRSKELAEKWPQVWGMTRTEAETARRVVTAEYLLRVLP